MDFFPHKPTDMFNFFNGNGNKSLIDRCMSGNERACKELYTLYERRLFAVCLRYARDRGQAEDMLQQTFITIFRKLDKYDSKKGDFFAWLYKICINECLMTLRKEKKIWEDSVDEVPDIDMKTENTDTFSLSSEQAIQLVEKLPDGYRTVFNLHVIEGYTHEEIGEILKVSPNTSKSQLFKAKKMLRMMALQVLKNEIVE